MEVEESSDDVSHAAESDQEMEINWKERTLVLQEELALLKERVNSQTTKIRDVVSKRIRSAEECARKSEEKSVALLKKMQEFEERTLIAENKVTRCFERNQHMQDIIEQKESIIKQIQMNLIDEQAKHDAEVKIFEDKVVKVKEWVAQIVGELQKDIEELKIQNEEKDKLIASLKNESDHPETITLHVNTSGLTNNCSSNHKENCSIRSKSAVVIPQRNIESEILPAVPPRRASLGILSRANPKKVDGKTTFKTVKEYDIRPGSSRSSFSEKIPEKCETEGSAVKDTCDKDENVNGVKETSDKEDLKEDDKDEHLKGADNVEDRSVRREQSTLTVSNSKFYISDSDSGDKAVVKISMRERLKQLTEPAEDGDHSNQDTNESLPDIADKYSAVDQLINSLEDYTQTYDEVVLDIEPDHLVPKIQNKPTVKPGDTDTLGYTKLWYANGTKDSEESETTNKAFANYLPPEFVLSPCKLESDSSGCSSLEHTPPMRGSWDPKAINSTVNGVISSEEWKRSSDVDTIHGTPGGFTCNLMQVQSCPVYAQLEGIASEIQSRPCTGDSTDSSDNETENMTDGEQNIVTRVKNVSVGDRLLRRGSSKKKVLKTCAQYTTHNLNSEALQKTGYLTKLGGRIKNWKKRWFVLNENKLFYYKSENDGNKKPLGQIPFDGFCGITRTEGSLSFQIDTGKRRYYLNGETVQDVDEWLKVLQNVLRKFMASPLLAQVNEKAVMKGWITKVKLGQAKHCYCILRGKYLCYYKGENDQAPFSVLNTKEVHIEKIASMDSEDELDNNNRNSQSSKHYTLRLYNDKQNSTTSIFLLVENRQDFNAWLYHLTMASGHVDQTGTDFEQTIAKLQELKGDPKSMLWNSTIITHSKEPLDNPLTTLPSEELENKALQLFKSIQLFCNTECVLRPAIDYHVVYAQNALQMCMAHVELREEIYCQLMKQTAKRVHVLSDSADALERFLAPHSEWLTARTYSVASDATIDLRPTREYVYEQCWQLLVLCCTLFVPRGRVLWFLKMHLQRHSLKETGIGKYAQYCQHCLDRTIHNGEREAGPSRMEVITVLTNEPFEQRFPLKIPVHFVNRTSEQFGFDGATTVQELVDSINAEIGLRSTDQSGYALYTDNPVGPIQHCLQTSVKVCDVIAKWEKAMQSSQQGRFEPNRMIKLSYKNRLYFKHLSKNETARERYFLVYQTFDDILHGRFPLAKDRCTNMAALLAQIEFGDRVAHDNQSDEKVSKILERFYPRKLKEPMTSEQRRQLKNRFLDAWISLMGKSKQECINFYLCMAKNWATFGAKLFKAKQRRMVAKKRDSTTETLEDIWLAVEEDCISILDVAKMNPVFKYKYLDVVTFGGWKEDFMLVINKTTQKAPGQSELGTERLLFVMPRGKILEITLLIASYINAIVRQQGLTFDVMCTTKKTTGAAEKKIKVWDMESAEWPMVPGAGLI